MPPDPRFLPRFAAEPPQELLPYGRWADRLRETWVPEVDADLAGDVYWFPDRSWHGRTYVPATARARDGREAFGYVSFRPGTDGADADGFRAVADLTEEVAESHPEWKIDLCDEVVGGWRGEQGQTAAMTLVWGVPLVPGAVIATAELADLAVDQCPVSEGRFTLLAPDDYRGDFLDIKLFNDGGEELARESLYEDDDEE
jgi:hypothetical protein